MAFIKINYTGRIKDGQVFDSSVEETAKKEGVFDEKRTYAPMPVVVGEGQVIAGLDEALKNLKEGDKKKVEIPPEKGYGKREPSLVRLIPMKVFKQQKINPIPGMPVELDGRSARVQTVAGGRVRVDFNHDLAGKILIYDVEVVSEAKTESEKVNFLLERNFGTSENFNIQTAKKALTITLPEKVHRDRSALVMKASFAAEAFKLLNLAEVDYKEVWKSPKKEEKKEAPDKE